MRVHRDVTPTTAADGSRTIRLDCNDCGAHWDERDPASVFLGWSTGCGLVDGHVACAEAFDLGRTLQRAIDMRVSAEGVAAYHIAECETLKAGVAVLVRDLGRVRHYALLARDELKASRGLYDPSVEVERAIALLQLIG